MFWDILMQIQSQNYVHMVSAMLETEISWLTFCLRRMFIIFLTHKK